MRALTALLVLVPPLAAAAPDWSARIEGLLPAGWVLPDAPRAVRGQAVIYFPALDTRSVALPPLLDRHWTRTDSYGTGADAALVSGTLDLSGDGYLAVTPAGAGGTYFFKIQRGMSGSWKANGRSYSVSLSVNIFRPRLNNYIVIRDENGVVWERSIRELFKRTYAAGEPVVLAGRPYRMFYSRLPADPSRRGLCFIYDESVNGTHEYHFFMIPLEQVVGPSSTSYKMFGADQVRLRVPEDLSVVEFSR